MSNPEAEVCPEMEGSWVERTLEGVVLVLLVAMKLRTSIIRSESDDEERTHC